MNGLLLHPLTRQQLKRFQDAPSHAVMLIGPMGSGKRALAGAVAEHILGLPEDSFAGYPYGLVISSEPGKAISIEAIRELEQFLALKVPGQAVFDRAIIIENAHALTLEAQNALLKTLEEPPTGTILILTATDSQSILPTVRSRVQAITLGRLEKNQIEKHFASHHIDKQALAQAYAISGGLPGLMHALVTETEHPLLAATALARQLLSQTAYQRLLAVDELSKQRTLAIDVTYILQQMAHVSLQTAAGTASERWKTILKASYQAGEALTQSGQPKLILTKLMLSL